LALMSLRLMRLPQRPQRGAARQGEDKRKAITDSSDDEGDDPDEFKEDRPKAASKPKGKGKGNASTKRGRPSLSQTSASGPSERSSKTRQKAKEKPATPQKKLKGRVSEPDNIGASLAKQTMPLPSPSKRRRTGDMPTTPTKSLVFPPPATPGPLGKTPSFLLRSLGITSPGDDLLPDAWDLSEIRKIGTPVWLRLTTEGDVSRNGVLWWPSQVCPFILFDVLSAIVYRQFTQLRSPASIHSKCPFFISNLQSTPRCGTLKHLMRQPY
jgi:hypothetical protein